MSSDMSEEHLVQLRQTLVGDQMAKIQLLTRPSLPFSLDQLFQLSPDCLSLWGLQLDTLCALLNIENNLLEELSVVYLNMIKQLYNNGDVLDLLLECEPQIAYKYMKLIELCSEKCPVVVYPHEDFILELFSKYVATLESGALQIICLDKLRTICVILEFCIKNPDSRLPTSTEFITHLEMILLNGLCATYGPTINFKYCVIKKTAEESEYLPFSNSNFNTVITIPAAVHIHDPLHGTLLSLSLVLYQRTLATQAGRAAMELWHNTHFNFFVSSLLKSNDITLKCASLTYLLYPYTISQEYQENRKKLIQILPFLIDSFNLYPLPWWYDPFEILTSLVEAYNKIDPLNNPVTVYLTRSNLVYGLFTILTQCLSLDNHNAASITTVTKTIRLSAALTAYDESYRVLLLEDKSILQHLEAGLANHVQLVTDALENKEVLERSLSSGDIHLPPLYDHELTKAWLYLLKSFSRSITALRTFLKRSKLAELLLELLRKTYKTTKECYFAGEVFLKAETSIVGMTLGSICNFVVEFSSLQSLLVKDGIIDIISEILTDPIFNAKTCGEHNQPRIKVFENIERVEVTTYALWVLRHLMFNCQNTEKLELLSKLPMSVILGFVDDPNWPVQEQTFQLIRNLTCNSRRVVNILIETFKSAEYTVQGTVSTSNFFDFLAAKMRSLQAHLHVQKKILEAILYIIVNLAAVNENKKELVINQVEILDILCQILRESPANNGTYGNDSDLKLAALWVLNNLLWNSSISKYTHYALEEYDGDRKHYEKELDGASAYDDDSNSDGDDDDEAEESKREGSTDIMLGERQSAQGLGKNSPSSHNNDDYEEDFVHTGGSSVASENTNKAVIERCRKLVDLGVYELVKENMSEESLLVKEKAKTLVYHMDLLLKEAMS